MGRKVRRPPRGVCGGVGPQQCVGTTWKGLIRGGFVGGVGGISGARPEDAQFRAGQRFAVPG